MKRAPYANILVIIAFLVNTLFSYTPFAQAQLVSPAGGDYHLPLPGVMVYLSPPEEPPMLKGIKIHPEDPFRFDFILDRGDRALSASELKNDSSTLIKYFLASLTIPENDLWVNLSPYEKDRIVPASFGKTEMGRDLLAEDYMLKQITASLIYPENEVGKKFWKRIYEEAAKKYGRTNIPVNTFNKVWIVPQKAVVYENVKEGTAYVVQSRLKVMLEQDYLAMEKNEMLTRGLVQKNLSPSTPPNELTLNVKASQGNYRVSNENINELGSEIVREIIIPELTEEVNTGKSFSHLRQVYNSLILATWYKNKIKDSILQQVYADKNKIAGVSIDDPQEKQRIYERYLKAFKKGVFNFIKEETDGISQEAIPRKYFSGGLDLAMTVMNDRTDIATHIRVVNDIPNSAMISNDRAMVIEENTFALGKETNLNSGSKKKDLGQSKKLLGPEIKTAAIDLAMMPQPATLPRRAFLKGLMAVAGALATPSIMSLPVISLMGFDAKALTQTGQDMLVAQGQLIGLELPDSLNGAVEEKLNTIFADYFKKNSHQIPDAEVKQFHLGHIAEFLSAQKGLLRKTDPYTSIKVVMRKYFSDMNERKDDLSADELQQWADIQENVMGLIQVILQDNAKYLSKARSVQNLIFGVDGKRNYNCDSISTLTMMVAEDWGLPDVLFVDIAEDAKGVKFPDADGIGHANNSLITVTGKRVFRDQRQQTVPKRVNSYRSLDLLVRIEQANILMNKVFADGKFSTEMIKTPGDFKRYADILDQISGYQDVLQVDIVIRENFVKARAILKTAKSNLVVGDSSKDLNSMQQRALELFKNRDYQGSSDVWASIVNEVDKLMKRDGLPAKVRDQLLDLRANALKNQETLFFNMESSELVAIYNANINNHDADQVKQIMSELIKRVKGDYINHPNIPADFKKNFDQLLKAAQKRFSDPAMIGTNHAVNGGIDLTPANLHVESTLEGTGGGNGITFHLDAAQLVKLQNAPGFVPVIISIQPLYSFSKFLGLPQVMTH